MLFRSTAPAEAVPVAAPKHTTSVDDIASIAKADGSVIIIPLTETVQPLLSVTVTSLINLLKGLFKTLIINVSEAISLTYTKVQFKTLVISVTTSVSLLINYLYKKTLTIFVNCGIILSKTAIKVLSVVSTVIVSLIKSVVSFTVFPVDRLIYAADKIRTATIVKFRKVFITKDQEV